MKSICLNADERDCDACYKFAEAPCRTNFNRQAETTWELCDICKELNAYLECQC